MTHGGDRRVDVLILPGVCSIVSVKVTVLPLRLMYWNTRSPAGGTVWGVMESLAVEVLLEEVHHRDLLAGAALLEEVRHRELLAGPALLEEVRH